MKEVTRAVRWAPETHSRHVRRGECGAPAQRHSSSGRETVTADNQLENIQRRIVQAKSTLLQNAKVGGHEVRVTL